MVGTPVGLPGVGEDSGPVVPLGVPVGTLPVGLKLVIASVTVTVGLPVLGVADSELGSLDGFRVSVVVGLAVGVPVGL